MPLDNVVELRQLAAIEILLFLYERNEPAKTTEILKALNTSQHPAYKALEILLKLSLLKEELLSNPLRRVFSLTEKGKRVFEKLLEIEKILEVQSEFRSGRISPK